MSDGKGVENIKATSLDGHDFSITMDNVSFFPNSIFIMSDSSVTAQMRLSLTFVLHLLITCFLYFLVFKRVFPPLFHNCFHSFRNLLVFLASSHVNLSLSGTGFDSRTALKKES